jgi:DNA repair exonuclease SbcCD nuclease subunit
VHYSLNTKDIADKAFRAAIDKAHELNVPLIDCGDLTNDKAILRGEVVNLLIDTLKYANTLKVPIYLLVGNHSLINEKGQEHVLGFLRPYAEIVDKPIPFWRGAMIPYQSTTEAFLEALPTDPFQTLIIAHQGFQGAFMGEYLQDRSSVPLKGFLERYRVFSGHYHRHQTVENVTYVGNPYTLNFAEANDPAKGFIVLNDDLTFERIILPFRKHIVIESNTKDIYNTQVFVNEDDLVWLKVTGPYSELKKFKKEEIGLKLFGHSNFKLDLIQTESTTNKRIDTGDLGPYAPYDIMDHIIDNLDDPHEHKTKLKAAYREIIERKSK